MHARNVHRDICALLLGALESLRLALQEFCTVLPHQWAALTGSTPLSNLDTEQRLKKLSDSAKVGRLRVWRLFSCSNCCLL